MNEHHVAVIASQFWRVADMELTCPLPLEQAVLRAVPLSVVKLARLGVDSLRQWLWSRDIPLEPPVVNRPLRACLLVHAGRGFVFLDGVDPEDEQRFSLAHEVAHYLLHYQIPRERALAFFGDRIRDVLDGDRSPTIEEQLAGLLRRVPFGTYEHLMHRGRDGLAESIRVVGAEDEADRLAVELLAPREVVIERLRALNVDLNESVALDAVFSVLTNEFGLPSRIGTRFGRMLVSKRRRRPKFSKWLEK